MYQKKNLITWRLHLYTSCCSNFHKNVNLHSVQKLVTCRVYWQHCRGRGWQLYYLCWEIFSHMSCKSSEATDSKQLFLTTIKQILSMKTWMITQANTNSWEIFKKAKPGDWLKAMKYEHTNCNITRLLLKQKVMEEVLNEEAGNSPGWISSLRWGIFSKWNQYIQ